MAHSDNRDGCPTAELGVGQASGLPAGQAGLTAKPLSRRRILFTSTHSAPFILEDLSFLREHYDVMHVITRGIFAPFAILRHVWKTDVTFTWFASVYSFLVVAAARLFGKPSLVVIAGVDVVSLPDIGYGIWQSPWKRWAVRWALRHATRVLPVDASLQKLAVQQAHYDGGNITTVPTGYDSQRWTADGVKENIILTVAGCENETRMKVKGLDFLFAVARRMETVRFVVVGVRSPLLEKLRGNVPANVTLEPPLSRDGLRDFYRRAKVYCLPSRSEGLPNSLCEAMLCECVPVGTAVGGIPEAIRENGFVVPFGDETQLAEALQRALTAPTGMGKAARAHIERTFPLTRRLEALTRIIDEVGT